MANNRRVLCFEFEGAPELTNKFERELQKHGFCLTKASEATVREKGSNFCLAIQFGLGGIPAGVHVRALRGLTYLKYLQEFLPGVPVMCVTGNDLPDVIDEITAHGAQYFFRERSEMEFMRQVAALTEKQTAGS